MQKKVYGYLGPPGTYSEMALLKNCGQDCSRRPYNTIREIVKAVKRGEVSSGLLPLENSLEGSVNLSQDLLLQEDGFGITGEVILPIEHCLMASEEMELEDIKEIYSHRQAVAQAGEFIEKKLPGVKITYTESTAAAAGKVAGRKGRAMIGAERISQLYELKILARDIVNGFENYTRFVLIENENIASAVKQKEENIIAENYKTSLICTPKKNRPGILHEILGEFAGRRIDLTRIESRPTKEKLGEYLFFIDIEGHRETDKISSALEGVREKCGLFKILGSYRKADFFLNTERRDDKNGKKRDIC
ncbi:MAG: prephenate dehydratase [Halanaerobiaceae bacterium]